MSGKALRKPKLLSGGNPQIAKADGDEPVQVYIDAMPGWKSDTGASLDPIPPVASKDKNARYFHIHEGDALDEAQIRKWVKQASKLPGWGQA